MLIGSQLNIGTVEFHMHFRPEERTLKLSQDAFRYHNQVNFKRFLDQWGIVGLRMLGQEDMDSNP